MKNSSVHGVNKLHLLDSKNFVKKRKIMPKNFDKQFFEENLEVLDYLKKSRLFGYIPEDILKKLVPVSEIIQYPKGAEILKEGTVNTKVFFLVRGRVSVFAGGEHILSLRRVGDIFGEMSIISHKHCTASVFADTNVQLFTISSKNIGEYQEVNSKSVQDVLYRLFSAILTEKLSLTTHKAKNYEVANNELNHTKQDLQLANEKLKQEISERKQAEEELRKKNEALIIANRDLKNTQAQLVQSAKLASIGELATGMAHELNQPLMYIRNSAQLAMMYDKENYDPKVINKILKRIEEGTDRMMKIIYHIRYFARQSKVEYQSVNVITILEDSLILFNEQLKLQNIHIEKDLPEDIPLIMGNAQQLEQVFVNIVCNARDSLKNIDDGVITLSVKTNDRGEIVVSFKDNGKGIPEEILGKIFDPFFTTKEEGKGTGLGLSISYGIIKEHRGQILVNSVESQGATFEIVLPAMEHSHP